MLFCLLILFVFLFSLSLIFLVISLASVDGTPKRRGVRGIKKFHGRETSMRNVWYDDGRREGIGI